MVRSVPPPPNGWATARGGLFSSSPWSRRISTPVSPPPSARLIRLNQVALNFEEVIEAVRELGAPALWKGEIAIRRKPGKGSHDA